MKRFCVTPLQQKFKKHVFIKLLDKVHKSYSLNLFNFLKGEVLQCGLTSSARRQQFCQVFRFFLLSHLL